MIATIGAALFTIILIALIFKLLKLAFRLSWGIVKGIALVAVTPCVLGVLFIVGIWYLAIPAAIALFVLAHLNKLK